MTCRSKIAKSFLSEIQDSHCGCHLENLFFASSPEPKGHLTWNMVGNMGVTCRSNWIAKIVLMENPRWLLWWPSWKFIFRFFSWIERPINLKLTRKCRSKIAKIILMGYPRWPPFLKSIFGFFSWNDRPVRMKLRKILDQYVSAYQRWIKSAIRLGNNEVLKTLTKILTFKF